MAAAPPQDANMAAAPPQDANMGTIKTFVVIDLEATGLPHRSEDYPVRVTEIAMSAVPRHGSDVTEPVPSAPVTSPPQMVAADVAVVAAGDRGDTTPQRQKRPANLSLTGSARGRARRRDLPPSEAATPPQEGPGSTPEEAIFSPVPTLPRLRNSLNMSVNPRRIIPEEVAELTGLDNDLLDPMSGFDDKLCAMLEGYLSRLPAPICLVAHNGHGFDFPLLMAELQRCAAPWVDTLSVRCCDSLAFFRDQQRPQSPPQCRVFALNGSTLCCTHVTHSNGCIVCNPALFVDFEKCDEATDYTFGKVAGRKSIQCAHDVGRSCVVCENVATFPAKSPNPPVCRSLFPVNSPQKKRGPSMKLPDVYRRRFGQSPVRSHCAGDDVDALVSLCLSHGEEFFAWADANWRPLVEVKPMWHRRPPVKQRAA